MLNNGEWDNKRLSSFGGEESGVAGLEGTWKATVLRGNHLRPPEVFNTCQTMSQLWETWVPRVVCFLSSLSFLEERQQNASQLRQELARPGLSNKEFGLTASQPYFCHRILCHSFPPATPVAPWRLLPPASSVGPSVFLTTLNY